MKKKRGSEPRKKKLKGLDLKKKNASGLRKRKLKEFVRKKKPRLSV